MKYFRVRDEIWSGDDRFARQCFVQAKDKRSAEKKYANGVTIDDEEQTKKLLNKEMVEVDNFNEVYYLGIEEIPEEHFEVLKQYEEVLD